LQQSPWNWQGWYSWPQLAVQVPLWQEKPAQQSRSTVQADSASPQAVKGTQLPPRHSPPQHGGEVSLQA
jgi:hypothetical protein